MNEGDEVIIPAPYWVSYPEMVAITGGDAGHRADHDRARASSCSPRISSARSRRRPSGWSSTRRRTRPGAAYTRDELKALTDVLMRHPHVWVLTDDMYEHLVYGDFEFTTPVQIEPRLEAAHADHERRLQGLCDDRLAHRLRRRPGRAHQGDGHGAGPADLGRLHDRAMGVGRGAERAAGLHPRAPQGVRGAARPRRLDAEPGASISSARSRKARSTSIRPAPARSARRRRRAR